MIRVKIRKVSAWFIGAAVVMGGLFFALSAWSNREFHILQEETDRYMLCEQAAKDMQDGSDYLTEQVRMYAMTGRTEYMENYFTESTETCRREVAVEKLRPYFEGTHTFEALQSALDYSKDLMRTEYYAMRLVAEAEHGDRSAWPSAIQDVTLTEEDQALSHSDKLLRAQTLVSSSAYQTVRTEIEGQVTECMNSLIQQTRNDQSRAVTVFEDMYVKLEVGVGILVAVLLTMCFFVRRLVVVPLMRCGESIRQGKTFPVEGADELQVLAETYNKVYAENQEAQALIRHKAEHDPLTDLLNRGSFEKLLRLYEEENAAFALIMVDVDSFKGVNDTYGHAVGDDILKTVAELLRTAFRSIDHVCRIGGDEFAIIMVEMTEDLAYTIQEKIDYANEMLEKKGADGPRVSLSAGVAFSQRTDPTGTLFEDADQALYERKKHGKSGCSFYKKAE